MWLRPLPTDEVREHLRVWIEAWFFNEQRGWPTANGAQNRAYFADGKFDWRPQVKLKRMGFRRPLRKDHVDV
jgi:hypothetical protein